MGGGRTAVDGGGGRVVGVGEGLERDEEEHEGDCDDNGVEESAHEDLEVGEAEVGERLAGGRGHKQHEQGQGRDLREVLSGGELKKGGTDGHLRLALLHPDLDRLLDAPLELHEPHPVAQGGHGNSDDGDEVRSDLSGEDDGAEEDPDAVEEEEEDGEKGESEVGDGEGKPDKLPDERMLRHRQVEGGQLDGSEEHLCVGDSVEDGGEEIRLLCAGALVGRELAAGGGHSHLDLSA
eukprot:403861-Hanusia_phi.AAC.3